MPYQGGFSTPVGTGHQDKFFWEHLEGNILYAPAGWETMGQVINFQNRVFHTIYSLTRGRIFLAMAAAAAIFIASPKRKGTIPAVTAFGQDREKAILSHGTPAA